VPKTDSEASKLIHIRTNRTVSNSSGWRGCFSEVNPEVPSWRRLNKIHVVKVRVKSEAYLVIFVVQASDCLQKIIFVVQDNDRHLISVSRVT
jgi:hypothetical protein